MKPAPSFADLKANPKNPRTISDAARKRLVKSLAEFGDLSGITLNVRTGLLVGGHQRIEAFRSDKGATVEITESLDKPDACGTVARGFVDTGGTRHAYRQVDWNKKKETAALIAANQHGGEFDNEALSELLAGLGKSFDYDLTGFDADEITKLLSQVVAPVEFVSLDENLPVEHKCPKCGYQWSGKPS